jgi:hypothetical protein
MAHSDWTVLFRLDHHFGALDLMGSGWPRSGSTDSVSASVQAFRSGSDGRDEMGGRAHHGG